MSTLILMLVLHLISSSILDLWIFLKQAGGERGVALMGVQTDHYNLPYLLFL